MDEWNCDGVNSKANIVKIRLGSIGFVICHFDLITRPNSITAMRSAHSKRHSPASIELLRVVVIIIPNSINRFNTFFPNWENDWMVKLFDAIAAVRPGASPVQPQYGRKMNSMWTTEKNQCDKRWNYCARNQKTNRSETGNAAFLIPLVAPRVAAEPNQQLQNRLCKLKWINKFVVLTSICIGKMMFCHSISPTMELSLSFVNYLTTRRSAPAI